jgi:hypothetical protein
MFAEAFHSMIKGIHLTLKVNTSFANSMAASDSSTKSISQKPRVPTENHHRHHRKREKKKPTHQKVTKQNLSDYAQQDQPVVTKRSDF